MPMITQWQDLLADKEEGIRAAGNAIQAWCICQGRPVTVTEAATAFNVTPAMIREAVREHYWMLLSGEGDDAIIEHEGE